MPKRLLRLPSAALVALVFALAGALMLGVALAAALVIEDRSDKVITDGLQQAGIGWVEVATDGLQVHLTGTAPDEAARFRALNLVGTMVDTSRLHDSIGVAPASALTAPRFSVEMLRNDDGIQLIGLVPEIVSEGGMDAAALAGAAAALNTGAEPTDMLQTATWPAPPGWDEAIRYGIRALATLKRSKVSVTAGRVEITAIAESEPEKRRFEADLRRAKPADISLMLDISAPRPVITPFTLRFIIDDQGIRFDACSADTERARIMILAAAASAGLPGGRASCTVGLGTPSPRWAEGVTAAIRAVAAMGAGSVTFSDADITFAAGEGVTQAQFDLALGDLRAALPDVFSLEAVPPRKEAAVQGPAEFTAALHDNGRIELRGRLVDEAQQGAVDAFARAAFGGDRVYVGTRLDGELPDGWPIRVLAGLEALALLHEGTLVVRADSVTIRGVTGSQEARAQITRILSSRLGQGQGFQVDVRYDERLDPLAALPTPQECAARVATVMARQKITFTPGSAEIAAEAGPVVDALAEVLRDCPGIALEIGGHTDSQGSEGGNQSLSQARAEAVLIALTGRRVDTSGMTAVGYGETNPIAENGTEAGREANRRIEFVLIGAEETAPGEAPPESEPASEDAPDAATAEPAAATPAPDSAATIPAEQTTATEPAEAEVTSHEAAPADEAPADEVATPGDLAPDFSDDTSPSVAPTEKTIRPKPRPDRQG